MATTVSINPQGSFMQEWMKIKEYTKENKKPYLLRFWVKQIPNSEADPLNALTMRMKQNVFGSPKFFPVATPTNSAEDIIRIESQIRDFDLIMFWKQLCKENPALQLPDMEQASQIRSYLKDPNNQRTLSGIRELAMQGIYALWEGFYQKYGTSHNFPYFKTEREIHNYLEDDKNKQTVMGIIDLERDEIVRVTTRLPREIKYLVNLEVFTFSNRKGVTLPKEFYTLGKLREVNINHSELEKMSKQTTNLSKLEKLSLIGTKFSSLPKWFSELIAVQLTFENKTVV